MRYTWLASVLRDAGLTVHEVSGWKTRGADTYGPVRGITIHHTAGSRTSSDAGELDVLINGRVGLSGPIAQLYLSRSGEWWTVAAGHCNHNKIGWAGPNEGYGNDSLLGIEAQHSGGSEPWTQVQYDSYVRGVAALVRHDASGWNVSVSRVAGHKEHQPGDKVDPTFNMNTFRSNVAREIADWNKPEPEPEDEMPTTVSLTRDAAEALGNYTQGQEISFNTFANLLLIYSARTGRNFRWAPGDALGEVAVSLDALSSAFAAYAVADDIEDEKVLDKLADLKSATDSLSTAVAQLVPAEPIPTEPAA